MGCPDPADSPSVTGDGQWQQGQPQDGPGEQPPYGQQPPYGPPPYGGQSAYGQPQYGQPQYGQPPYGGQPGYGPTPYGQYGQPGWPQPALAWPHGPRRPGLATAAAVLGIVTGSLTLLGGSGFLIDALTGDGDLPTWLLALGLPVGACLIVGGIRLLGGKAVTLLLWSAVAAVVLLVLALLGGLVTLPAYDVDGLVPFIVLALPLPIVTAALTAQQRVRGWAATGAGQR